MNLDRARRWSLPLLLTAVTAFSIGAFLPKLGFYVDDWVVMANVLLSAHSSLLGRILDFQRTTGSFYFPRPVSLVYFPAVCWLGGLAPWKYQLTYLAQDALAALAVFFALATATRNRPLAFLTACLFAAYPSHGATHHTTLGPYTPAMALFAASLWLHAVWLDRKSAWALIGSLACFAAGDLAYEAVFPLIILMPALGLLRGLAANKPWRQSLREALLKSLPLAALAVALVVYFVLVQRAFQTFTRHMVFEPGFALKVLGRGFECSFTELFALLRRSAVDGARDIAPSAWALAAVGVAAFAVALPRRQELSRVSGRIWLIAAIVAFVAAYAPYAVSADHYVPHLFDDQNRINGAASLPAAMLAAWLIDRWGGRARTGAFAAVLAMFTVINWQEGRDWAQAYSDQTGVLRGIEAQLPAGHQGDILIRLKGAPDSVGTAPVFADWAFDAALRAWTGRGDVYGASGDNAWRAQANPWVRPLVNETIYDYDYATGRLAPEAGPTTYLRRATSSIESRVLR